MKKTIIILVCCVLIITGSIYLVFEGLTKQALAEISDEDIAFLESLEFKTIRFGTDVAFVSDQFEDLEVGITSYSMYGYEPYGTRYGDYIVIGSFYKDGKTIDYNFDIFPYESSDDLKDDTYSLNTDHLLSAEDQLWVTDPELINIFNQFIIRVEQVVSHDYQTDFSNLEDYDFFSEYDIISSFPVIGEKSGYQQYDCEDCYSTYIKGTTIYEVEEENNMIISDYDFDKKLISQLYLFDSYKSYQFIEDSDISQVIYVGDGQVNIEYLEDDVVSRANQLIAELNTKYTDAKTNLL